MMASCARFLTILLYLQRNHCNATIATQILRTMPDFKLVFLPRATLFKQPAHPDQSFNFADVAGRPGSGSRFDPTFGIRI